MKQMKWTASDKDVGINADLWEDENGLWRWSISYIDGSGFKTDVCSSRRLAIEEVKTEMAGMTSRRPLPRFRKR